jgi:hypothetical protein
MSVDGSEDSGDDAPRGNENTLIGLIFELKEDEDTATMEYCGHRFSGFAMTCGIWVLVGFVFGMHWWLLFLTVLKFVFALVLAYLYQNDYITLGQRVCRHC